jgi:DUF4097 and DUF4098 domain-containing protein YvlB
MAGAFAGAQQGSGDWQKSYPVTGKASLTVVTGDASLEVRSCGACSQVRVRVDWMDRKPSEFVLSEFQSGNHVNFELKEKPRLGIHFTMGNWHEPQVRVETPEKLDLEARTSDGGLKVSGVQGSLELHTSDGGVEAENLAGSLRLAAGDGSIRIHNLAGSLELRSSDGNATIDGRLSAVQIHTSDGNLDLTLNEGSQLAAPSRVESSDGKVTMRVARTLAANLEVETSDGQINCSLPLTMEGYNSSHSSGHNLRGRLNAGGVALAIHTSDGNVTISAL